MPLKHWVSLELLKIMLLGIGLTFRVCVALSLQPKAEVTISFTAKACAVSYVNVGFVAVDVFFALLPNDHNRELMLPEAKVVLSVNAKLLFFKHCDALFMV